ncbi:hypothetical protein Q8A67_000160 [Cirrhinus molitorella]|uniref:Uncharacterized protein n=1 Tax=Cirrhinus molitorella TaxID=172907 RepID=A0AA88Q991_9TELE|nr:hypothetical protein Q8A67_000160 [Cirrhinus molitorella]
MATAAGEDTVWIGFMDIVPVIGTVKEAVELVLAVYEGNKAVVMEKEKAIENIKLTRPDKPAAAPFSGNENVIEIRKAMIAEHVMKGSKRGTKPPTPAEQKERQKRVEAIQKDMLEKIHIVKPKFSEALKEELTRSKRGEHVFNNDILKFHSKVLTEFIQIKKIYMLRGYNEEEIMEKLGKLTLPKKTAEEIQTNMVVHFEDDEFYVNANAVVYGVFCSVLRGALLDVLGHINPDDVTEEKSDWVNFVIDTMNKYEIYVDQLAKDKWINKKPTKQTQFEQVRREVAHMYKTDRGLDWCREILKKVAPWFEFRQ